MKHRSISLAAVLVFLACLSVGLFHPGKASATPQTDAATAYCTVKFSQPEIGESGQVPQDAGDHQDAINACVKGFLAALKGNASKPPSNNQFDHRGYCYTNLYKDDTKGLAGICQAAYIYAYNDRDSFNNPKPATPAQKLDNEAYAQCVQNGDIPDGVTNRAVLLSNCTTGYTAGKNGKTKDEACQSIPASITVNAGLVACQKGYSLATAQGGGDQGDDQPSCEASGFSLSWIFCPIINGLADAVDSIYSSLVQPLLETKPINLSDPTGDPTHTFEIWSNFRVYGNIFLVLALLVVVFGESISGGLIDAYTAKKILPRLLLAAILINISIYIVAFAVDITNIIGNGIANLIEAPFKNAGAFKLEINGSTGDIGMAALVGGGIWAVASLAPLLEFLLLFFLIPAFLTFIAILVTVLLRQGLIIFLILIAPIAFALYCLPNTEQYFRKWWDLLFKTLLIYPIIAVMFALANVLSVTINSTTSGITKTFADFISIIALFVPLFLIPYSFRLAGGVLGKFHEFASNARQRGQEAIKGNANDPSSWRNMTRRKLSNRNLAHRERAVNKGISLQKNNRSAFGRVAGGTLAGAAGLGNYQLRRSQKNKEASELVQAQTATGNDSSVRAIFAEKMQYRDPSGKMQEGYFGPSAKRDPNGVVIGEHAPQFSEFEVRKARSGAAHDSSFYQAAYTYEIGKAGEDQELDNMRTSNAENIKSSPYLRQESVGIVKGSGFAHVQDRREMKHENLDVDAGAYTRNSAPFTRELAENVSNWSLSNMRTSTPKAAQDDYKAARAYLTLNDPQSAPEAVAQANQDIAEISTHKVQPKIGSTDEARDIMRHVESTAAALDARRQQTGSFALTGDDKEQVVAGSQTGAAGHVSEEIQRLVDLAAPSQQSPPRPGAPPASPPPRQPDAGSQSGGGLVTPDSPDFKIPRDSRPGGSNFQ